MTNRCPRCGNETPFGNCYTCGRNQRDEQRDSGVALRKIHRRPPGMPWPPSMPWPDGRRWPRVTSNRNSEWDLRAGIWRSKDRSITLDFVKQEYQDLNSGTPRKFDLTVLGVEGLDISLRIGRWKVKAWVDKWGNLVLHRKTMMAFLCLVDGKMHKLWPGCRHLSRIKIRDCKKCGRSW